MVILSTSKANKLCCTSGIADETVHHALPVITTVTGEKTDVTAAESTDMTTAETTDGMTAGTGMTTAAGKR